MSKTALSDAEGKTILRAWPRRSTKLFRGTRSVGYWLRAQPPDKKTAGPTLVAPGAKLFVAQPDGLWLWFGELDFVDVIAVEVCRQGQNLNDKRSRYMPTNHALLADCSRDWLIDTIALQKGSQKPRWQACRTIKTTPQGDSRIPVRHLRVLYALPNDLYDTWLSNVTPAAYEFFCQHSSLNSHKAPPFRDFLNKMMPGAQFYTRPKDS